MLQSPAYTGTHTHKHKHTLDAPFILSLCPVHHSSAYSAHYLWKMAAIISVRVYVPAPL